MTVRDILLVQQRELEAKLRERYVERDATLEGEGSPLVKVITGPRRAGKSFFAIHSLQAGSTPLGYVNFDDERLAALSEYDDVVAAIDGVYGTPTRLLLDEVQNLPRWELFVNRLARQGYDLTVTGSNAHLLSSELSTHLTGRYMETSIFPFSFREYLRWTGRELTESEKAAALSLYARTGGYPEPLIRGIDHRDYLSLLFDSIVYKDVVKRHRVRASAALDNLARYLVSTIANEYSFTALSKVTQNNVRTVQKHLGYLEEAFIFFSVPRFSYRIREQIAGYRTIYCIDNGFVSAKGFRHSDNDGRLYQNLVAVVLKRQEMAGEIRLFSWKNVQGEEVDFVVQRGNRIDALIQVCADASEPSTRQREIRALLKAGRDLSCTVLYLLTETGEGTEDAEWFGIRGTVRCVPLWKWLEQDGQWRTSPSGAA